MSNFKPVTFEDWLALEVENARKDYRDTDPGESWDTARRIRERKEILEDVFSHFLAFKLLKSQDDLKRGRS